MNLHFQSIICWFTFKKTSSLGLYISSPLILHKKGCKKKHTYIDYVVGWPIFVMATLDTQLVCVMLWCKRAHIPTRTCFWNVCVRARFCLCALWPGCGHHSVLALLLIYLRFNLLARGRCAINVKSMNFSCQSAVEVQ